MLQGKAMYNLLRLQAAEDPSVEAPSWALEDLRAPPLDELFRRLREAKISLDRKEFLHYAETSDTPEELAELLLSEVEEVEEHDRLYLLLFEVWRRLLPEKQSLSLFCDELDHQISLYDQEALQSDEAIQDLLASLAEILGENVDAGGKEEEVLAEVANYCAHDLEAFLYSYISDLLDGNNLLYAEELIDAFAPYMKEKKWLSLLKVRLEALGDPATVEEALPALLRDDDFAFLLEILSLLAGVGEPALFKQALRKILPLIETQEELLDVMETTADYYRRLDDEAMEQAVQQLMGGKSPSPQKVHPEDLKRLEQLLKRN